MFGAGPTYSVGAMARRKGKTPHESAALLQNVFAALRRHNEHRRRVAQMLEAERKLQLNPERERRLHDHVIQARRKHHPHQAR